MKRTISLVILALLFIVSSSNAQWKTIPAVVTAGDSVTAEFVVPDDYVLSGVQTPALTSGSDTLKFDVKGQQNNAGFEPLYYDGAIYIVTIDTTGTSRELQLKATVGWQVYRGVLDVAQSATDTLYFQTVKMFK